jgi:pimeloyl-ACP methyl ester carboxylesterase
MNIQTYITGSATSKDGTAIGYRQLGHGPGVILVHGAMMASQDFMELAGLLSDEFTVYVPDRRGRGLSGPIGDNYSLVKECEDMQALINKTGALNIFGLSSGAIIALQTALTTPMIRKVSLYEPPLDDVNGPSYIDDRKLDQKIDREIAQGKPGAAFASIIKAAGEPTILSILPRSILEPFMTFAIREQAKQIKGDQVSLETLVSTFHYDMRLSAEVEGKLESYKTLQAEVLLLGGSKSKTDMKSALNRLSMILPHSKRIEIPGLGHSAGTNNGKPERVARELRLFFNESIQ